VKKVSISSPERKMRMGVVLIVALLLVYILYAIGESLQEKRAESGVESQSETETRENAHTDAEISVLGTMTQKIDQELLECSSQNGSTYGLIDCYQKAQTAYDALVLRVRDAIMREFDESVEERRSWVATHSTDSAIESMLQFDESYVNGIIAAKKDLKDSQNAFMKYRESLCAYAYNIYNDGSMRYVIADQCYLDLTKAHLVAMCSPWTSESPCVGLE
jgi:uncharacterized protein YecT (DUF1311 family)